MPVILETGVNLAFLPGHHLHCLIAQIPNRLRRSEVGWAIADPDRQWRCIQSVLDLVAEGPGNLKRLTFLLFPESVLPVARLDQILDEIGARFRPNTVTMFGIEHVPLRTYRSFLEAFRDDNREALALVDRDIDSGDVLDAPVNWCCVAVKEQDGRLRVFLEAKSHPFRGEEFLDANDDLYRGRHFYLFRDTAAPFNFMVLVCLDYLYRNLYQSNIARIVDHANELFFRTRQSLGALFVVQSNPKPEHPAYRDVLSGFYGEYLEDTPGVRETVTVFGNCSDESEIEGLEHGGRFGASSIVIGPHHHLPHVLGDEYRADDFGGAPLWRLRFGTATRLYYVNLPFDHEIDPRSSRFPLKVHAVFRPDGAGGWTAARRGAHEEPEPEPRLAAPAGVSSPRG